MPDSVQLIPITYYPNAAKWFLQIRHLNDPVWLDSGQPNNTYGQFDIICADPRIKITTFGTSTKIETDNTLTESSQNPFELLKQFTPNTCPRLDSIPFCGGALGYFGYDLARQLEDIPSSAARDIHLPDMKVGIYPWAIIQDHHKKVAWLVINNTLAPQESFAYVKKICTQQQGIDKSIDEAHLPKFSIAQFKNNINACDYQQAITRIQQYILAGDCYQVNFAQRFSATYEGDTFSAYLHLRSALPSPFSAYISFKEGDVLCLSPERFISLSDKQALTQPIKGTAPRGASDNEDKENAKKLSQSQKDRAENLMIVDLLRNDFSKSCTEVKVPVLFELQSFANVHHLVSTITGTLQTDRTGIDLLSSCFPGGSITGAPKIRAMEIIEELEPTRRSVYCGSIGYISSCGNMDTNIAIRTLVAHNSQIYCWGGGGIVADSEAENEYQESFAKINVLMKTLEKNFTN